MNIIDGKEVSTIGRIQPNSLVHDDCLNAMRYIEDGSVDLVLCDPPYG